MVVLFFSMKIMLANTIAQDGTLRFRQILAYPVYQCPIKKTPGLYGLNTTAFAHLFLNVFTPRKEIYHLYCIIMKTSTATNKQHGQAYVTH